MSGHAKSAIKIVFGSMTLGREGADQARVHDLKECAAIMDVFQEFGHDEIDTARSYGDGSCEEYLSKLDLAGRGIVLATKLSPTATASPQDSRPYTHSAEGLRRGLRDSLKALGTDKFDTWYLHAPDHDTPYEETLREVNNLYREGYFRRFGISKYSAWETAQICEICQRNGWKKPDVYQGVYSAFQRSVEPELFACLRYYGVAFYQYNPLAGGLLTDRYRREDSKDGRFDPSYEQGVTYRKRYWNDVFFDALDIVRPVAAKLGMSTAEAALRWSVHHSLMRRELGDAIIVGASSAQQLRDNLTSLGKGPLPQEMVDAFDEGWAKVKSVCEPYFK